MTDITIPALPAATVIVPGSDVAAVYTGGVTSKATPNQIVQAVLPAPGPIGGTTPGAGHFSSLSVTGASGLAKATAGVFGNATANTDYLTPPAGTSILKGGSGGALANATAGVDYQAPITAVGLLKGSGSSVGAATSGSDYAPATSGSSILAGNGAGGFSNVTVGTGLQLFGGTLSNTTAGTVTTASVVSTNGFAGTVANPTTTPAITLSTTVTGLLKGNGTAISAASSGVDYAPATSGSTLLAGNGTGGFSTVTAGTGLTLLGGTLSSSVGTLGAITSVSGTATGFTGITAARRLTLMLSGVAVSSGDITIQIGSGSYASSGYVSNRFYIFSSTTTESAFSNGWNVWGGGGSQYFTGSLTLTHMGTNIWIGSGNFTNSTGTIVSVTTGFIQLGGVLDRIQVTSAAFSAGTINYLAES